MTIDEQIVKIGDEIRETPYHKATEHHIGKLKAKLSKLRAQMLRGAKKGKGGGGGGFGVKKQGDATVVLLGFPSVGKSTLINKLTNADSKIAPYAFTTVSVIPGMMRYHGAYIQILDLPGIIEQASHGKGRGRQVLSVVKSADLILAMTEVGAESDFSIIEKELKIVGVLLNVKSDDSRIYDSIPAIYIINKIDTSKALLQKTNYLYISAEKEINLENLRELIWEKLHLKRVYLKQSNLPPDMEKPLIVEKDADVYEIALKISTEMALRVRSANIWLGNSKFPNQKVSLNFFPADRTVVELNFK